METLFIIYLSFIVIVLMAIMSIGLIVTVIEEAFKGNIGDALITTIGAIIFIYITVKLYGAVVAYTCAMTGIC